MKATKQSSSYSTSKSSKKSKDKERKKSRSIGDNGADSMSSERTSKDNHSSKLYTVFGSDSISCIIDQNLPEQLSESVRESLAEDVSYKIRELLHNARLRMRMGKRKCLKVTDIDSALQSANAERIYGPAIDEWVPIGDADNCSRIKDSVVNLPEVALSSGTYQQCGPPTIETQWLTANSKVENRYVETIIKAVLSNNCTLQEKALKNLRNNTKIGSAVSSFLNFCFYALQDNRCDKIIITQILRCIAQNRCSSFVFPEKQLKLLACLLVSEMFLNSDVEFEEELSKVVPILVHCWPMMEGYVLETIMLYSVKLAQSDQKPVFRKSVVLTLCSFGQKIMNDIFWPNLYALEEEFEKKWNDSLASAILIASSSMYREKDVQNDLDRILYSMFGDSIVPMWNLIEQKDGYASDKNKNFRHQRRRIRCLKNNTFSTNKSNEFPFEIKRKFPPIRNKIVFSFHGGKQVPNREKPGQKNECPLYLNKTSFQLNPVLIGKLHRNGRRYLSTCNSHNLLYCL